MTSSGVSLSFLGEGHSQLLVALNMMQFVVVGGWLDKTRTFQDGSGMCFAGLVSKTRSL